MSRVLAAVAARLDSTRLPRKALTDVAGVPLLRRVLELASTFSGVDDVVLCTTQRAVDDELVRVVGEWGFPTFRGAECDMLDRFIGAARAFNADYVVRVTGDNPFSDPAYASALIAQTVDGGFEYGRVQPLPLGVTVEVMSRVMMERLHQAMSDPNESEYLMLYAFDPASCACLTLTPTNPLHQQPALSLTVDTEADRRFASTTFERLAGRAPTLSAVLQAAEGLLDERALPLSATVKVPRGETMRLDELFALLASRQQASTCREVALP